MIPAGFARADEFNDARLHSGEDAYAQKRYPEAIDQFRIAAFGFLDRPTMLSECLVRLALAQSAGGKTADALATLGRFVEVERRFAVYPKANLEPETRSAFQALLMRQVPSATIQSIPTLASLIETEEQKLAKLPPAERRKALEAAAKREPGNARWPIALAADALATNNSKDAIRWATKALSLDPANADALGIRARALTANGDFADALKDLGALSSADLAARPELSADRFVCLVETGNWAAAETALKSVPAASADRSDVVRARRSLEGQRARAAAPAPPAGAQKASANASAPAPTASKAAAGAPVPAPTPVADPAAASRAALADSRRLITAGKAVEAERVLTEALKSDPGNRELRLNLLEAACLVRAYALAAAQIPLVAPFTDTDAIPMFYAAVVLYETGHGPEAKGYLQRAMPAVSGPLVDEYAKKILGNP